MVDACIAIGIIVIVLVLLLIFRQFKRNLAFDHLVDKAIMYLNKLDEDVHKLVNYLFQKEDVILAAISRWADMYSQDESKAIAAVIAYRAQIADLTAQIAEIKSQAIKIAQELKAKGEKALAAAKVKYAALQEDIKQLEAKLQHALAGLRTFLGADPRIAAYFETTFTIIDPNGWKLKAIWTSSDGSVTCPRGYYGADCDNKMCPGGSNGNSFDFATATNWCKSQGYAGCGKDGEKGTGVCVGTLPPCGSNSDCTDPSMPVCASLNGAPGRCYECAAGVGCGDGQVCGDDMKCHDSQ